MSDAFAHLRYLLARGEISPEEFDTACAIVRGGTDPNHPILRSVLIDGEEIDASAKRHNRSRREVLILFRDELQKRSKGDTP